MAWSMYLYSPLFIAKQEMDEFYGKLSSLGRTAHLDIVNMKLHGAELELLSYVDEDNIHYINDHFDPDSHYRFITQQVNSTRYLILAMESSYFAMDSEKLIDHYAKIRRYALLAWIFGLFTLAHFVFMDYKYYRKSDLST